jgi:hypothetical protein
MFSALVVIRIVIAESTGYGYPVSHTRFPEKTQQLVEKPKDW